MLSQLQTVMWDFFLKIKTKTASQDKTKIKTAWLKTKTRPRLSFLSSRARPWLGYTEITYFRNCKALLATFCDDIRHLLLHIKYSISYRIIHSLCQSSWSWAHGPKSGHDLSAIRHDLWAVVNLLWTCHDNSYKCFPAILPMPPNRLTRISEKLNHPCVAVHRLQPFSNFCELLSTSCELLSISCELLSTSCELLSISC